MLYFHHAGDLYSLWNSLHTELKNHKPDSVLQPQTIIVPNRDIGRWIQLRQAEKNGISANLNVVLPAAFIHSLNLRINSVYEQDLPDKRTLTWNIFKLIRNGLNGSEYDVINTYAADDSLKQYQLASKIADLFDKYMLFRGDWLSQWSAGKTVNGLGSHEVWQRGLWSLIRETNPNFTDRSELHRNLLEGIKNGELQQKEPIFVFAIGTQPPIYLEALCELSNICDVHWFRKKLVHPGITLSGNPQIHYSGHPILERFADEHANHDLVIHQYSKKMQPVLNTPIFDSASQSGNLLQKLQSDLQGISFDISPEIDSSLSIHACHNEFREVQVLQDEILDFLQHNPDAGPGDILVITPDITRYAGIIHSVFGTEQESTHRIPYRVNDSSSSLTGQLSRILLDIMQLHKQQFRLSAVLNVLESEPVRNAMGFSTDDLSLIAFWLKETGIRWGLDADFRKDGGIHSWQFGMDRLLLGLLVPGKFDDLCLDIMPFADVEGADAQQLIGKLAAMIYVLQVWMKVTANSHKPSVWKIQIEKLLDVFFSKDDETETAIQPILDALQRFEQAEDILGEEKVSLDIILDELQSALESNSAGSAYRSGSITFSPMVPVRHLPFRFIGILGVNEATFPGRDTKSSFDLMSADVRPGDRSIRLTNRALILDAVLAAKDRLHLSYQGFSIRDGSDVPPSVVITELLDYVAEWSGIKSEAFIKKHRLHGFHPAYFKKEGAQLRTYSAKRARLMGKLREFNNPEFASARLDIPLKSSDERPLVITLDEIIQFLTKPYTWLMENRLGMRKIRTEELPNDRDPFLLDGLENWKLNQVLLQHIRDDQPNFNEIQKKLQSQGLLEYGEKGRRECIKRWDEVRQFWESIPVEAREIHTDKKELVEIELKFNDLDVIIQGQIPVSSDNRRVIIEYSSMKAARKLKIWVLHLMANMVHPSETVLFTKEKSGSCESVAYSSESKAQQCITEIISKLLEVRSEVLPAFPEVLEAISEMDDESKINKKLWALFNPNAYYAYQTIYPTDEYASMFINEYQPELRTTLDEWAEVVWGPILKNVRGGMDE